MTNTAILRTAAAVRVARNDNRSRAPTYLEIAHHAAGRLRLKLAQAKQDTLSLEEVRRGLAGIDGATSVTANPHTGSIIVKYDPQTLPPSRVLDRLARHGYMAASPVADASGAFGAAWTDRAAQLIGRYVLDVLAERAAFALIGMLV